MSGNNSTGPAANSITRRRPTRNAPEGTPDIFIVSPDAPDQFLQKLHEVEGVHDFVDGYNGIDMLTRLGGMDLSKGRRVIFAWRDPEYPSGALISVQAALTTGTPDDIHKVISVSDIVTGQPDTMTLYSISNWGRARGVGEPFLKELVNFIHREFPHIKHIVTLSPIPKMRSWITNAPDSVFEMAGIERRPGFFKDIVLNAKSYDGLDPELYCQLAKLAALHILGGTRAIDGSLIPNDHVVHGFHQKRGAVAERLCLYANNSLKGFEQSWGLMVNFANSVDPAIASAAYERGEPIIRPEMRIWLPPRSPANFHRTLWTPAPQPGA